jgi:hypothetical protein
MRPRKQEVSVTIEIRPAAPSDAAQIHAFITELAVYERAAHEVIASADDVRRTLFAAVFLWHCPAGHPGLPLTTTVL